MITFDSPEILIILAVIPTAIYLRHYWRARGGRIPFSLSIWRMDTVGRPRFAVRLVVFISNAAFWLGAMALLVALSGPSFAERERVYLNEGIDIFIILDQSPSMAAQDFAPRNRFTAAKGVIRDFVGGRENDAIGLITFGDTAALRVPPTKDYEAVRRRLGELELLELGKGTAIGMGLAVACAHFRSVEAKEQVAIILTDGKNNAGEITPLSAARIAEEMGVRVYTIGVGTEGKVPIELNDPESDTVIRGTIESQYDAELLTRIAEMTGGRFFTAGSPGSLQSVFADIDSLEAVERRVKVKIHTRPIHRELIAAGLALLTAAFLLRKLVLREVL
jgi:Ca-activated chloride channel family protein